MFKNKFKKLVEKLPFRKCGDGSENPCGLKYIRVPCEGIKHCCTKHDQDYVALSPNVFTSNHNFFKCVSNKKKLCFSIVYYVGVTIFGTPLYATRLFKRLFNSVLFRLRLKKDEKKRRNIK
jgi:hypothetical protein